jgi:hypothetical protein
MERTTKQEIEALLEEIDARARAAEEVPAQHRGGTRLYWRRSGPAGTLAHPTVSGTTERTLMSRVRAHLVIVATEKTMGRLAGTKSRN